MPGPSVLETPHGSRVAYHLTDGMGPCVVFLGGLRSDMDGTKAVYLERWASRSGRAYLRFDYSGHGRSSGTFEEGCIGDWTEDAATVVSRLAGDGAVLVGSSMGGWIALNLATRPNMAVRIRGFVGIAAAPDFTEDSMWAGFSEEQRRALERQGEIALPNDYSDEPYVVTRRLIVDGRENLVLREPFTLPFPVRLLHGTADTDVDISVAMRLLAHADGNDIRLTLVKDADHRFSTEDCLRLIEANVEDVLGLHDG
ncbi:MAG: alpha/beta hydrolase [Rhodobacter sp.]|nr:alpha/beta hydrolase [Rhodobacter sp.]MCY4167255.1 alpha/beta hydrolase [Rhodobacter sp.]